jgi:hypothetical protein
MAAAASHGQRVGDRVTGTDDLTEFPKRRLADRENRDDNRAGILDALIEWREAGCPPPTIRVTYRPDESVAVVEKRD